MQRRVESTAGDAAERNLRRNESSAEFQFATARARTEICPNICVICESVALAAYICSSMYVTIAFGHFRELRGL